MCGPALIGVSLSESSNADVVCRNAQGPSSGVLAGEAVCLSEAEFARCGLRRGFTSVVPPNGTNKCLRPAERHIHPNLVGVCGERDQPFIIKLQLGHARVRFPIFPEHLARRCSVGLRGESHAKSDHRRFGSSASDYLSQLRRGTLTLGQDTASSWATASRRKNAARNLPSPEWSLLFRALFLTPLPLPPTVGL